MKKAFPMVDYTQTVEKQTHLRGQRIPYITKPGLPQWNSISPSTILLAENTDLSASARVLLLGCGSGALAVALAHSAPEGEFWLIDISWIALLTTRQTLQLNQVTNARIISEISVLPAQAGSFQTVVIDLPKGRKLAQRWLVEAYQALVPGGALYLAGANDQGVQSIIADAYSLFGNSTILAYKKGRRIARLVKPASDLPAPAWAQAPGIAPGAWYPLKVETPQGQLNLCSLPGVFSYDHLDNGTRLLLETWHPQPDLKVLDLGCGYGIIGLLAAQAGATTVDLIDENLLAIACARQNVALYQIHRVRVLPSDALSAVADQVYDQIVTNPPFHSGQAVDYSITQAFIQQSWQALAPGGQLWLVANRFIPYEKILTQYFSNITRLAETGRYHVLRATK